MIKIRTLRIMYNMSIKSITYGNNNDTVPISMQEVR